MSPENKTERAARGRLFFGRRSPMQRKSRTQRANRNSKDEQKEGTHAEENGEEREVHERKLREIGARLPGIMREIGTKSDQTRERRDKSPHPADIDAVQEREPVGGESGEEDGGRDIRDHLTGEKRDKKGIPREDLREKVRESGNPCNIPREEKETDEGEEQGIIDFEERASVEKEQSDQHHRGGDIGGKETEHGEDDPEKQEEIKSGAGPRETGRGGGLHFERGLRKEKETEERDEENRREERHCHDPEEPACRNLKISVEIEVLRIPERGEHSAKIGGGVLQNEDERHVLFLLAREKDETGERQESQERHVVRYQHGAEKSDIGQAEDAGAEIPREGDHLFRENGEEPNVPECTDHGEGGKQASEGRPVKIGEICRVRVDENHGERREDERNQKYGILLCEREERVGDTAARGVTRGGWRDKSGL